MRFAFRKEESDEKGRSILELHSAIELNFGDIDEGLRIALPGLLFEADEKQQVGASPTNMATQSHCQLCEGHMKEWEIAQSTLSALRSEVVEIRVRENEAIKREECANDKLHASLRREEALRSQMAEVKRESQFLRASLHASSIREQGTSAEPLRISQDTADLFPRTPAQLISCRSMSHATPGNADLTVEIPTTAEANGDMAPASVNVETLDNISPLKVAEACVLLAIPEVEPLTETTLNLDTGGELEIQGGVIEEALNAPVEPNTQEQEDMHQQEKESQSYETHAQTLEAVDHHMDHAVPSCDERSASSASHRKRRRLNLVQSSSDEDDEASPASKKRLFETSFDNLATPKDALLHKEIQQGATPESPGSTPESPGRVGIVGMEFGGGITVSELVTKEPEVNGKATPKHSGPRLRRKIVNFRGDADATEQPLKVELRRSQRLSQLPPIPSNDTEDEIEDEIESSDKDSGSFIVESSAESSESSEEETNLDGHSEPKEKNNNVVDLSDSDSESGPPLARRLRSSQPQAAESSESAQSRSSSDRLSSPVAVNLLRTSLDDVELDDNDDDRGSLSGFIVRDSSSSEESVSNSEEHMNDSDSDGRNSGSQGTFRAELNRKRQNLIWDFEGDMLVAIQTNNDIAVQAICALYRQQTKAERSVKGALHRNGRGFDRMNARRGSKFAEFLVDGDESGLLKRSARALETRFPGALQICQGIACHHSKQLFEIYSNNEDPFWGKPIYRAG